MSLAMLLMRVNGEGGMAAALRFLFLDRHAARRVGWSQGELRQSRQIWRAELRRDAPGAEPMGHTCTKPWKGQQLIGGGAAGGILLQ
jgi:hypothetical protein